MPTAIPPDPGIPRQPFPVPRPPVQLPRPRAEPDPPAPPIDPTLPGWARGGIALLREATRSLVALLSPGVITQVGLFVAMIWGGNRLDSKIDAKHDDTKKQLATVEKKQEATHEKLDAIKGNVGSKPAANKPEPPTASNAEFQRLTDDLKAIHDQPAQKK